MSAIPSVGRVDEVRAAVEGPDCWIVGGAVRDLILGRPLKDIDIVVAGDPKEAARRIGRSLSAPVFPLSEDFGAWRVVVDGGQWQVDVNPLAAATIDSDLGLRDFTINAIAQPIDGGGFIDPFGGQRDLAERRLVAVSESSFASDPLRVLRLVRFVCELSLEVDDGSVDSARKSAAAISDVAMERVFDELSRILISQRPLEGIALLEDLRALEVVLPEVTDLRGVGQSDYHHLDVHDHTLEVLSCLIGLEADPHKLGPAGQAAVELLSRPLGDGLTRMQVLRWAALLHDCAKPTTRTVFPDGRVGFPGHDELGAQMARTAMARLKASAKVRDAVAASALHHLDAGFLVHEAPLSKRLIHGYLKDCGSIAVDVTMLSAADRLATRGRKSGPAIEKHLVVAEVLLEAAVDWEVNGVPQPLIRGDQLAKELNIPAGKELGLVLAELEAARYCGEISTDRQAIDHARRWRDTRASQ